ncbi:uncharacterized protein TNIN_92171 [Trichonephila inaurata madagascariensis]|uniref:Uncharacterized protein n=1 Tax=Trichonephila inaurata madagascariensis TaxID=2747483 RepID=A0A8X7CTA2_9ARAC|nr:uncharacterized protein TNIN_92171 [Trichonephila inaurata madagascariensis]
MLTLKRIIEVKLVTDFINDCDTRKIITHSEDEIWKKAIKEKTSAFHIPLTLEEDIIALIKPIESEVFDWMEDHDGIFTTEQKYSLKFCFNADGTVDRVKTADSLIHSKWLDEKTRFVLACQYLSSMDILSFFKKMNSSVRLLFLLQYSKANENFNAFEENVVRWVQQYKAKHMFESKSMCWCPIWFNWTSASLQSRLLDHLLEDDCIVFLDHVFENTNKVHLARFCMFRMSVEYREDLLKRFPLKVLRIYLSWPCHHFFLDAANKVWDLLPGNHFFCLLHIIICQKIVDLWEDFDYVELLRQFWRRSPDHLKQCVEGTDIFEILMEIVKHGFHQKDAPRHFFLHANGYYNVARCDYLIYKIIKHQ